MGSIFLRCDTCGLDLLPGWVPVGAGRCPRCEEIGDRPSNREPGSSWRRQLVALVLIGLGGFVGSAVLVLQLRAGRTEGMSRALPLAGAAEASPGHELATTGASPAEGAPTCCAGTSGVACESCPSAVPTRALLLAGIAPGAHDEPENKAVEVDGVLDDHAASLADPPAPATAPFAAGNELDESFDAPTEPSLVEAVDGEPTVAMPRRVRVRDDSCRVQVARLHGGEASGAVMLPDGQLGWPDGLAFTDEPFAPITKEELRTRLLEGPFQGFSAVTTEHYVVVSQGTSTFAEASGRLLESVYAGLLAACRRFELPVSEAEFPLVAIIYETEAAFRAANDVAEEVEAYYDIATNRIHLYETSEREREAPDLAALRKPQTVAHEGVHQILQNIGVQPRLASWPPWLIEGLAEFFAPTTVRPGDTWDGANRLNPFHMATIRELHDPFSATMQGHAATARPPGTPLVEHLVTRTQLTSIDYAVAWAVTHYLVNCESQAFRSYLLTLGAREPGQEIGPDEHLADFRAHFGENLGQLDRAVGRYLSRLKEAQPLSHYAVFFEQPLSPSVVRRSAFVSQSPAMIRRWVEENRSPQGGHVSWRALPFPTRSRAQLAAQGWLGNR